MEQRIVEFVEVLRQNGLKIAISETQDAVRAVADLGVTDRELFRASLKATLCKRALDAARFDRCFELVFTGAARTLEGIDRSLAARLRESGLLEGDDLQMLMFQLGDLAGQLMPLARAALEGDRGQLAGLFRQASLQLDFSKLQNALQSGFYSRRLLTAAGADRSRTQLEGLAAELKARGVSAEGVEVVSKHLDAILREIEAAARAEVQRQVEARLERGDGGLADRKLATMSRAEVELAQRAVRALAEKLKARLIRKQRSKRKGQLNPRRTLRMNLTAGGVPMVPQFRSRRPQRPDVVVLCDISDSVRTTSRMMLLFMWTLQSLFTRVRSFVFVSELGEVTKYFERTKPEEALEVATSGKVISVASNSNYGHALATFARAHLGLVTRRTTVFIIGDGRNNYNERNLWALEDIKRKAKRVVWIATEPRNNWGFGDSEMRAYAKACTQAVTVQTLGDLERIAPQLVPS